MNAACLALVALLSGPPTTVAPGADPVVARAQGPRGTIVVTAARLRNFAQAHPGVPVETLLRDLIDFELLVAEARAVDLHEATEVTFARAQAMVARYLADTKFAFGRSARARSRSFESGFQFLTPVTASSQAVHLGTMREGPLASGT